MVGPASELHAGDVGNRQGRVQQFPSDDCVEDERQAFPGIPLWVGPDRRFVEEALADEPGKQSSHRREKVVEASRTISWAGREEGVNKLRLDLGEGGKALLPSEQVKEP